MQGPSLPQEPGASQSYLAVLDTVVRVVKREGLFLLQEPGALSRVSRMAEHVTFTVLEPDAAGNLLLQVEAHPLDPTTLRPQVAPTWRGVYAVAPGERQARLVEGAPSASPLIAPNWLFWEPGTEQEPFAPLHPGERRSIASDMSALSLPLLADNSDLALGIVPTEPVIEFVGWETAEEGGEAAALVRLTMGLKSEAESGNFLRSFLSGEQTVTARLVPGDFPLSHAVELRATLRTEAGAEDTFGLAGRVEIETTGQVYFGRTASLQLPSVDPLQAGDMVGGVLSGDGWVLEDGTPAVLYTLRGREGELVRVVLTSQDFDAYLLLLDDQWEILAEDNDSAGGTDAAVQVRLPGTGEYLVVVNTHGAGAEGRFVLAVESLGREVDPATMGSLLEQGWHRVQAAAAASDWDGVADALETLLSHVREQLPLQIAEVLLIMERAFDYGEYVPRTSRVYRQGDWIHVYVEPRNFHVRSDAGRYEIHLTVDATLIDADGNVVNHLPGVMVWNRITHSPVRDVALSVPLWVGDVAGGNYVWRLTVRDMVSGQSATAEVPIVVAPQSSMIRGL